MANLMKSAAMALMAITSLAWIAQAQTGAKSSPKFEVRLAEDKPGKGLTEATVEGSTPRKVFLHKEVILSTKDIAGAKAITIDDKPALDVSFTPAGAKTLTDLTTANVGKRLAIILDGKVRAAPLIRDGITEGKAHITGAFTREETEKIARVLIEK
jgi:preprotein translocase subunit SecD